MIIIKSRWQSTQLYPVNIVSKRVPELKNHAYTAYISIYIYYTSDWNEKSKQNTTKRHMKKKLQ